MRIMGVHLPTPQRRKGDEHKIQVAGPVHNYTFDISAASDPRIERNACIITLLTSRPFLLSREISSKISYVAIITVNNIKYCPNRWAGCLFIGKGSP